MSATELIKKVYKPAKTVGQVYARVYGGTASLLPLGNVLELSLEHKENVETQEDMSVLGGGLHAEARRVESVSVKMKLADLNVLNLTRACQATVEGVEAGTVTDEPHTLTDVGGLVPLLHINSSAIVVKKGADSATATVVPMTNNWEPRAAGVFVLSDAPGFAAADKLWISYEYGDYAVVEALTQKAAELELLFEGLNEADEGKPVIVNVWRASQGVTKALTLLNPKGFGSLEVEGSVMKDPTKTGQGISKFYRARMA